MLSLPNVTLVCYDAMASELAEKAVCSMHERVRFADFVMLTGSPNFPKTDAARAVWYDAPELVKTSHFLNVEWDSGIIDAKLWTDEFLEYDYIGAPWYWHEPGKRVGNGGFSLRSTRLMKFLSDHREEFPIVMPDDATLCGEYRERLESKGFKWASEPLARRFSWERSPREPSFGFHGAYNMPSVLTPAELAQRIALANDYVQSKNDWREMLSRMAA